MGHPYQTRHALFKTVSGFLLGPDPKKRFIKFVFLNPENGWSVLRVNLFDRPEQQETVTVHQTKVFAGATMEFKGAWTFNPKFGRQFKATEAIEKKPATTASTEKYLGSGLIKGVGPKTAKKIVKHFDKETLEIFEYEIDRLTEVSGIAQKKLTMIVKAWREHRVILEVMYKRVLVAVEVKIACTPAGHAL